VSLAVAAEEAGHRACVLEVDRAATVSDWAEHRTALTPEVACLEAGRLDEALAALREAGFAFVFIDTAGLEDPGTRAALDAADLCVVPCRPTPADLRAVKPTLAAIYRAGKRFAFVLNQTPPRSYRIRDAADGLAVLGVLPDVNVVMRNDHQDALGMGQGVTEFNPEGQAAGEIRRLLRWIEVRAVDAVRPRARAA
jgi:chromosome partitioning protein